MKKKIALLLTTVMALGMFGGCGSKDAGSAGTAAQSGSVESEAAGDTEAPKESTIDTSGITLMKDGVLTVGVRWDIRLSRILRMMEPHLLVMISILQQDLRIRRSSPQLMRHWHRWKQTASSKRLTITGLVQRSKDSVYKG